MAISKKQRWAAVLSIAVTCHFSMDFLLLMRDPGSRYLRYIQIGDAVTSEKNLTEHASLRATTISTRNQQARNDNIPSMFNKAENDNQPINLDGSATEGRLVLATTLRSMTNEHPDRKTHIKFHLHCVADAMRQSNFHIIVYTSDDETASYIANNSDIFPMEVVKIPEEQERQFKGFLNRTAELHPHASGYGFFNGDVCFTPGLIDATNAFFEMNGPKALDVEAHNWRFVSGLRWDAETRLEDLKGVGLQNPLQTALSWPRSKYQLGGVDFFAWNHAFFHQHIIPFTPNFLMPLWVADNFLFEDGNCNALTLLPEHGWNETAMILHLNHKPDNGMPNSTNAWLPGLNQAKVVARKNLKLKNKVDKSLWKTRECSARPDRALEKSNDCIYHFDKRSFSCKETARGPTNKTVANIEQTLTFSME